MRASASNSNDHWKDRMFRLHVSEFVQILEARPVSSNLRLILPVASAESERGRFAVLDLACGSGRLFKSLSEFATIVVGFDYSPELLAHAASKSRELRNVLLMRGDARELKDIFVEGEFDAIVRAFTSLGYFTRDVEADILRQCAYITRLGGKIVIDCFNKTWFESNPPISRATTFENFTLEEQYKWDEARQAVSCLWRYLRSSHYPIGIPFSLDGYGTEEIVELLELTNWRIVTFLEDLVTCSRIEDPSTRERIVVVAERI